MILTCVSLSAWPQQKPPVDLTEQSLEDLMNMQVTSVSKQKQSLSQVATAIFVITQEDIRQSGATNIPDLLRMVPGLDVAQIDANSWAISARGFNGRFSNDLLVLMDGRSVYVPTFGGVFWDVFDLPLGDIDRIEVIRGPGGSIWGANAVNGVVNIVTKKAAVTRGAMVEAGGGNVQAEFGTSQYGGAIGKHTDYRLFAKYQNFNNQQETNGSTGTDGWHVLQGGFRVDSTLSSNDTLTLQGDLYEGREGLPIQILTSVSAPPVTADMEVNLSGGFLQGIWNHSYSARSDSTLAVSYDRYARADVLGEKRDTLDVDFQHHIAWGRRQDIVWGLDYRYSSSTTTGSLFVSLNPANLRINLFSAFFNDQIALYSNRLYLTVGTKLEHNNYTGFAVMPSARLAWTLTEHQTLWWAVSHAVHTPAENEAAIRLNVADFTGAGGTPVLISILGNPNFKDEGLIAYEMGYRTDIGKRLSVDLALYYNNYSNQLTQEPSAPFFEVTPPPPPHLVLPMVYANLMHGEAHGAEVWAHWKVNDRWTLSPGYAFEQIHMHLDPSSHDTGSVSKTQGGSPVHSAQLRSHVALLRALAWDTSAYFVSRIASPAAPSYVRLDTGLTWEWKEGLSFSAFGQNLLNSQRLEYVDSTGSAASTLVKRGAYAKMTWRFR